MSIRVHSWFKNNQLVRDFADNTRRLQGRTALLQNLFLRNEPNFTSTEINISNCIRDIYNDFQIKLKIGTNPNEPKRTQSKPISSPPISMAKKQEIPRKKIKK